MRRISTVRNEDLVRHTCETSNSVRFSHDISAVPGETSEKAT